MTESPTPQPPPSLAALRAEIDTIDTQLLGLMVRRSSLAAALAGAKGPGGSPLRPAREVQLMRRLVAGAPEGFDPDVIVAVWRALIGANIHAQRPIEVVTAGAGDAARQYELARAHFGAQTRITALADVRSALSRAADSPHVIAILPWPGASGPGSWWAALMESRYQGLAVVAGLPMRAGTPEAAVVASGVGLEPAGRDRTLMVAFDQHFKLARALQDTGAPGRELARANAAVLFQIDDFIPLDSPRRQALIRAGLDGARVVGTFALL